MLTKIPPETVTILTPRPADFQISLTTDQLLELGISRGWELLVLGQAPYPLKPVSFGDWVLVPATQDDSPLPMEARERMEVIAQAGIVARGYVIAHEVKPVAPALAPTADYDLLTPSQKPTLSASLGGVLKVVGGGLGVVAVGLVAVAGAVVVAVAALAAAAAVVAVPLFLVAVAQGIDPKLIVVLEDGTWVQVYQWDE